MNLHVGDKVKVLRKYNKNDRVYNSIWQPEMGEFVGKTYDVIEFGHNKLSVMLHDPMVGNWFFSLAVIKKVED